MALKLFLYCILRANHKATYWEGEGIEPIFLKPGQFICSRDTLAEAMNRRNSLKRSAKQWYRYLRKLEKLENVSIETTSKFSIVTIVNWEKYQSKDKIHGGEVAVLLHLSHFRFCTLSTYREHPE